MAATSEPAGQGRWRAMRDPGSVRQVLGGPHRDAALGGLGLLLFFAFWEIVPRVDLVDMRYVPPFSQVASELGTLVSERGFWTALGQTLRTWGVGLVIAATAGLVAGLTIGSVDFLRRVTATTIEFLRPIPSVAIIPVAVLMYGTGMASTLAIVVYASFWQMLLQVLYGVQDVDPVARDTARSFRFSRWSRARRVVWPSMLPFAVVGLRLAATVALILTITGELIIGTPGLGDLIATAQTIGATGTMYALVAVTGILGVVVDQSTRRFERRALHWHHSIRAEVAL